MEDPQWNEFHESVPVTPMYQGRRRSPPRQEHRVASKRPPRPRVVEKLPCLAATAFGDEHAQLRGAET